jgi:hypothetical protein
LAVILAGIGIGLVWLGGSILVLSDARRGLAVGLLLADLGLALAVTVQAGLADGGLLLAGGLLAVAAGLRGNPRRGWGLLQGPSTPRVVLCVVMGGAGLWLGLGIIDAPGQPEARAAATMMLALGAGRLFAEREPRSGLAAATLVALGAGALAAMSSATPAAALVGAVAAVALNLLPTPAEEGLESG